MIKYKFEKVEQTYPDVFICDSCDREIEWSDVMEIQEAHSICFTGGYSSVFGDGSSVSCDLCQDCLYELIGKFCYINGIKE